MNRGAAERAVAESKLSMAEKLTMMMLLRRAHNDTLEVPDWRTPSLPQLADEVTVTVRHQRRLLTHLALHDWVKVNPGRGRGHKSVYLMLPTGVAGDLCTCHKRGPARPLSRREKGTWRHPEKGTSALAKPQVGNGFAPRAHQGGSVGKGEPACIGGCGKPARRGCATCWDHASLEAAL